MPPKGEKLSETQIADLVTLGENGSARPENRPAKGLG